MIDYNSLSDFYKNTDLSPWIASLETWLEAYLSEHKHGDFERWHSALKMLPEIHNKSVELKDECRILGDTDDVMLMSALRALMPWRKGPFFFSNIHVDTEWHSDWKWARVSPHVDLTHKNVLDVGCGNGYYGFRMLGAGAKSVIGIDPNRLFLCQFNAFKHYAGELPIWYLPIGLEEIKTDLNFFDTVFSMGVFYHRRSPIDHLIHLRGQLKEGGSLILETLVIDGGENDVLVPEDRYAQMRNIWFLPSILALEKWLRRAGYKNIRCVDVSITTVEEQRTTDWMSFQSLESFLDPNDHTKTIEGYPAPKRAVIIAEF